MSYPFVGEIRFFAGTFPPQSWLFCDGAKLAISEYESLFALIGNVYGGDGQSTFALPDFRGRVPLHQGTLDGQTYAVGDKGGREAVTLTEAQMPSHTHAVRASGALPPPAVAAIDVTNTDTTWVPASPAKPRLYASAADLVAMGHTVAYAGSSQPHDNMAPYLALNFIIATDGRWPSQS